MIAVLLVLALGVPQESLDKKVNSLVERLRSEEIEAREAASKDLVGLGESAIEHLDKAAGAAADPETATRLKAVIVQIRRNALISKVAPPAKLVTVSANEVPLRDFLKDVCAQAGVEFTCDGPAGEKPITINAKDEPLLQVVDRACAERGDLAVTVAENRLKVMSGKWPAEPTAYAQAFRLRVRKAVLTDTVEGGAVKTSAALYLELDAQPDQKIRGTSITLPKVVKLDDQVEVPAKGIQEAAQKMAGWISAGVTSVTVDGVAVGVDSIDSIDRTCFIKELPAGTKKIASMKVTAKFRYSVGLKSTTMTLTMRSYDKMPDIPYQVNFSGQQLYFMPEAGRSAALEEFIDLDSMVLLGKDGKETKLSAMAGGIRGRNYMYQAERALQAAENPQLRMQVVDAFDREVEFELKDIKLRD